MKKSYFYGLSLLVIGMTFVGCVKNDVEYDENFAYKQKAAMYEQAFVEQFGSIAANHDWGFGQTTGSSTGTRGAIAGSKNDKKYDCGFVVPDDLVPEKTARLQICVKLNSIRQVAPKHQHSLLITTGSCI